LFSAARSSVQKKVGWFYPATLTRNNNK